MKRTPSRASALAALACAAFLAPYTLAQELTPVSRVQPEFPREAVAAGADKGHVKARMTLDASGEVSRVDILEANPRRLFDRAVIRTLSQWRYPAGAAGRTVDIDVDFQR